MRPLHRPIIFATLFVFSACSYVPFAGGALKGTVAPPPADWQNIADVQIIQLETRPTDPYSVKLWIIAEAKYLYVYAGEEHSQWAQNVDANPAVRLKVEDTIYELHGERIIDDAEFKYFAQRWKEKYNSDRTALSAGNTYLYKLTARKS